MERSEPAPPSGEDEQITVQVRLGVRLGAGRRTRAMRLARGARVKDLLELLAPDLGLAPERLAGVAVAIQGEIAGRDRPLRDGETVALVLPVAGG